MKIAFVGLGNMGGGMAANQAKAGHEVSAFDLSKAAVDKAAAAGEDPDWPCIQRKVSEISPAQVWSGPAVIATATERASSDVTRVKAPPKAASYVPTAPGATAATGTSSSCATSTGFVRATDICRRSRAA